MKDNLKIVIVVLLVIIIGSFIFYKKLAPIPEPVVRQEDSIKGCHVATLAKDVYTINILSQTGETFKGTLKFKNFEKDSSSGTYEGTYKNDILLGDYSFDSEGMHSVIQVIFKKTSEGFVRGFGDMSEGGIRFADLNKITYDTKYTFKSSICASL